MYRQTCLGISARCLPLIIAALDVHNQLLGSSGGLSVQTNTWDGRCLAWAMGERRLVIVRLLKYCVLPGVIGGGFGAVEAIKRLGLERRLFTMGKYKGALDPFKCAQRSAKPSDSATRML